MSTQHVTEAFEALQKHEPEWERGFLQHILMVALNTPGAAMNVLLPQALVLLPAYLRNQPLTTTDDVCNLLAQLHALADLDPRFLKNFMDGKPCAPFI